MITLQLILILRQIKQKQNICICQTIKDIYDTFQKCEQWKPPAHANIDMWIKFRNESSLSSA